MSIVVGISNGEFRRNPTFFKVDISFLAPLPYNGAEVMRMVVYFSIQQILDRIEKIHREEKLRPTFFDVVTGLYRERAYFTEPTNPLTLEKMSVLEDREFILATTELRIPVFFKEKTAEEARNVPDYMPWDNEVVALFGFPGLRAEYHTLEGFEVAYVLYGQCEMHMRSSGKRILKQGDLVIIPPGMEGYLTECEGGELAFIIPVLLHAKTFGSTFFSMMNGDDILSDFFTAVLTGQERPDYLLFETGDNGNIRHLARRIFLEQFYTDRYREGCSELLLKLLFSTTLRQVGLGERVRTSTSGSNLAAMLSHIQSNYRTLTLRMLADKFHYSEAYLSGLIKDTMGISFVEIVRNLRMREARELLEQSRLSVSQIAEKVGYCSTDHFSRVFRTVHGVAPQAYRKKAGGK